MQSLHGLKGATVIACSAGRDLPPSPILQKDALPGEVYSYIAHSTFGVLLREAEAALAMPPAMLEDPGLQFWWLF